MKKQKAFMISKIMTGKIIFIKINIMIIIILLMSVYGCNNSSVNSNQSGSGSLQLSKSTSSLTSSSNASSNASSASASIEISPTPEFVIDNKYVYVKGTLVNIRELPTTKSRIIKQIHYRTKVKRTSIIAGWSRVITDNDEEGYIVSDFLSPVTPSLTPTNIPMKMILKWSPTPTTAGYYFSDMEKYIGRTQGVDYQPLKGLTIIIDPAHGGNDIGLMYKSGEDESSETSEKEIDLGVAKKLQTDLKAMGAEVVMTRYDDRTLGLYCRSAFINKYILEKHKQILIQNKVNKSEIEEVDRLIGLMEGVINFNNDSEQTGSRGIFLGLGANADLRRIMDITREYDDVIVISLHCNSIENNPEDNGTEIYYDTCESIYNGETSMIINELKTNPFNPSYQYYNDIDRGELATAVRDEIKKQTPLVMRGGNQGIFSGNHSILRENNLSGIIIELGFLSNNYDRTFLTEPSGQMILAHGISNGIYNYFCETKIKQYD